MRGEAMDDHTVPEEKLLRLIKKGRGQNPSGEKNDEVEGTTIGTEIEGKNLKAIGGKGKGFNSFKILFVLFLLAVIYFLGSICYPFLNFPTAKLEAVKQRLLPAQEVKIEKNAKDYKYYLEGIRNKQIFSGPLLQERVQAVSGQTANIIESVALVGILGDDNPQAIIEDKKSKKIYYARKGEFVGDFQVMDIQEGKVILRLGAQSFELFL